MGRLISGLVVLAMGATLIGAVLGINWWTDRSPAATPEVLGVGQASDGPAVADSSTTIAVDREAGILVPSTLSARGAPAPTPGLAVLPEVTTTTLTGTSSTAAQPVTTQQPVTTTTTGAVNTTGAETTTTTLEETTTTFEETTTTCAGNNGGGNGSGSCRP